MASAALTGPKLASSSSDRRARPAASGVPGFFYSATAVYGAAAVLRLVLLVYGLWQDARSPIKYTDIDYLVFTDAARFVVRGQSPYARETYRYTPLLAWLLTPAGRAGAGSDGSSLWTDVALLASGKLLFAAADLVAGWLLERVLVEQLGSPAHQQDVPSISVRARARLYASVWLLNPMVATISTRGSSEGLLGALVAALLWAVQVARRPGLAGVLLGAGVHLKIYPFIYAPAIVWWMDADRMNPGSTDADVVRQRPAGSRSRSFAAFLTPDRWRLALASLTTFFGLNAVMLSIYGFPFLQHTFLHHVSRIDHRHNFSPYNTQLYLSSAASAARGTAVGNATLDSSSQPALPVESLAFLPQLLLSSVLIPLVVAKKDLATSMLAQTFAFVTFNKVCTSQYFLWYMVLLPVYLPHSPFVRNPRLGIATLALWVAGQAAWLQQGYELEFLGRSTFVPGLWLSSLAFFAINSWILGLIVGGVA
ncbi:mannosyltransferase [Grosmannia clavigera kw1407]|uniref:GPI mannosyltransferase 1 n=1 Tax=Grosmannia clavigera (strain kw1407 / UAMH 11150) TaxID=655863 RepID=F0XIS6_GROCL|nr:mannosyltransferase [Grosmannia clavigera kw1407]EFX02198.1 mannosyltransferase [Grosmannia clavigera kw1407]